jgi:hypothetical protein
MAPGFEHPRCSDAPALAEAGQEELLQTFFTGENAGSLGRKATSEGNRGLSGPTAIIPAWAAASAKGWKTAAATVALGESSYAAEERAHEPPKQQGEKIGDVFMQEQLGP